ncbi:hypothetical protein [Macrococcus equi]|uniref:hypothetical protein n=1 Tax=Macrococcus equi TaxID=3395462 RepID=UPI0039BE4D75
MSEHNNTLKDRIKEAKLEEKAKIYVDKSKQFSHDKDLKNKSKNYYEKFKSGLMNLERTPVLIASFLLILFLWIPMMYGSVTTSILEGQDALSNKELTELQHRLEKRVSTWGGH